ncbi:hypothetical protein FG91_03399 [Sphingopyxis sp. LC81]|nr:hypothetical protein FG91_03399 [Sphingopyxis sp. LC81]
MHLSGIWRLAVIAAAATTAAITIQSVSYAQVSGEKPTVCHGFYSHVPDGFHPNSTRKFDSYPFSVEVQPRAVKIMWLDFVTEYVEKQPSIGEIVTGYDDWAFGNFRILCGDKGSVVLVADRKGEGVQTLKLSRSNGDIFTVAEARGWPMAE